MKIYRIIKEDGYSLTELDFVKGKKEAAFYLCYLCNGIDYMDIARDLETGSWIYKSDIGEKEFCKKINKLTIKIKNGNDWYYAEPVEVQKTIRTVRSYQACPWSKRG